MLETLQNNSSLFLLVDDQVSVDNGLRFLQLDCIKLEMTLCPLL